MHRLCVCIGYVYALFIFIVFAYALHSLIHRIHLCTILFLTKQHQIQPMDQKRIKEEAYARLQKDLHAYRQEIEQLKDEIKAETDERNKKHLNALLIESQKTLTDVLLKMENFKQKTDE